MSYSWAICNNENIHHIFLDSEWTNIDKMVIVCIEPWFKLSNKLGENCVTVWCGLEATERKCRERRIKIEQRSIGESMSGDGNSSDSLFLFLFLSLYLVFVWSCILLYGLINFLRNFSSVSIVIHLKRAWTQYSLLFASELLFKIWRKKNPSRMLM